jgi:hypothetical protein
MEYLEGETLAERLKAGPLPLEQALRYGHEIAVALGEAHRRGIVHRDLKPANIMLTRSGVKVLDFGLAKLRAPQDEGESRVTRSFELTGEGVLLGTLPYMAPEQVEGGPADARTDIFAFGAVLYEMVTGSRPFKGDSRASLIAAILTSEPEPVSRSRPVAPPLLDRVVRRCLAKDPDERWQTAKDLAAELAFVLESGSQAGISAPAARRRRNRSLLAGGLVGAALAAGVIAALAARSRQAPVPTFQRLTFRTGYITSARLAPDGESVVYSAAWDGRPAELFLGRLGSPEARPLGLGETRVLSISRSGEMALLRSGAWGMLQGTLAQAPLAGGAPRDLLQDVTDADWIADTGQLAVLKGASLEFPMGNKVFESASLGFLRVAPSGDRVALLEWSGPAHGDVIVVDRAGKKTTLSRGWVGLLGLAWSPKGDEVWFSATRPSLQEGPPAIRAVSLSGAERLVARAPTWLFLNDVRPDGRVLLGSNVSRAGVRCLLPGAAAERELGWLDSSRVADISADGKTIVLGEGALLGDVPNGVFAQGIAGGAPNGAVYLRGTDGSPAVRLGEGYPADLSPDGKWVLAGRRDGKEWTLLPTGPGMPKRLPLGPITSTYVGQFLDDRRLVFSGFEPGRPPRGFVQELDSGTIRPVTPEGVVPAWYLPALPDGRTILAGSMAEQEWRLYPVDGGEPRPIPFQWLQALSAWSADGRSAYVSDVTFTQTTLDLFRLDVASGRRQPWRTIAPSDPAGLEAIWPVVVTPDGSACCYTYTRTLGTLYAVDGLR